MPLLRLKAIKPTSPSTVAKRPADVGTGVVDDGTAVKVGKESAISEIGPSGVSAFKLLQVKQADERFKVA
jgi:hypothetical protein